MELAQITEAAEALKARQEEILAEVEAGTKNAAEAKALVEEMKPELDRLHAERVQAEHEEEMKALKSEFSTLASVIEDLRKPSAGFTLGSVVEDEGKGLEDGPYISEFLDIREANKGNQEARARLSDGRTGLNAEGKAMTEGVAAQGGYLVRPVVERQIVTAVEQDNILRQLCSSIQVNTNAIQLDQIGLTTAAGWVAELAQKPETTGMSLATITANVFTAAGLATISNQLLADSNPAIDGLVVADLAKRLRAVEEQAFLAGTGTNQPLGILNTPGIGGTALSATDVLSLLDAVLDAIATVETAHGSPTAILMHPRTWTRILKSRDAQGAFYIDPTGGVQDPRTGVRGPSKNLWGVPVYTTNRMPTNLGTGTNESRVVVGDFKEALILDRQGVTVDESPHVYFTTNQTVFRAEKRLGFTAARTPAAFNVVGGAGLANG